MAALVLSLGTFGYCVVSGLVPFVNAELYLLGASALAPPALALPLVLAATLGQMTAKVAMYGTGRGMLRLPGERLRRWVMEAESWAQQRREAGNTLIFVSAASGFPPFYMVSIACGVMKVRFFPFLTLGFLGRLIRFGTVVLFPQLLI